VERQEKIDELSATLAHAQQAADEARAQADQRVRDARQAALAEQQAELEKLSAQLADVDVRIEEARQRERKQAREDYEAEVARTLKQVEDAQGEAVETHQEHEAEMARLSAELTRAQSRADEAHAVACGEYQAIFDSMSEMVVVHDLDGRILFANGAAAEAVGVGLEALVGRSCFEVWRPQGATFEVCPGMAAVNDGAPSSVEVRTPDGRALVIEGDILRNDDGNVIGAIEMALDVTACRETRGRLSASLGFSQTLLDGIPYPVFFTNAQGQYQSCNDAFARGILGLSAEQIIGSSIRDLDEQVPEELLDAMEREDEQVLRRGGAESYEATIACADGRTRTYACHKEAYRDADGEIVGVVGAMMDISGLQSAQGALEAERRQSAAVLSRAPAIIAEIKPDGTTAAVYGSSQEILGYEAEEFIGRNWWETLFPGELRGQLDDVIGGMRAGLDLADSALTVQTRDGEQRTMSWTTANLRNDDHELLSILAVGYDITDRARSEGALQRAFGEASERVKKLRCLSNALRLADDSELTLNEMLSGIVAGIPPAWRYPGITTARVRVWERDREAGDASGPPVATQSAEIVVNSEVAGEVEVRYHEARPDIVEGPFTAEERDLLDLIAERIGDTIERRSAQESFSKLLQFRHTLIEQANMWLMALDRSGNVVLWNRAAEKISGYSRDEVVGHDEVWEMLYPDDDYRAEVTRATAEVILASRVIEDWETVIRRKDGTERVVSWNSRKLIDDDGTTIGSVTIGRDVSARRSGANTDPSSD